jgi:hypothetical protein
MSQRLIGIVASLAASLALAAALDKNAAIDVAKRQVKGRCSDAAPCAYTAERQGSLWKVRVQFTERKPDQKAPGHAIFIIDQNGKIIGRVE